MARKSRKRNRNRKSNQSTVTAKNRNSAQKKATAKPDVDAAETPAVAVLEAEVETVAGDTPADDDRVKPKRRRKRRNKNTRQATKATTQKSRSTDQAELQLEQHTELKAKPVPEVDASSASQVGSLETPLVEQPSLETADSAPVVSKRVEARLDHILGSAARCQDTIEDVSSEEFPSAEAAEPTGAHEPNEFAETTVSKTDQVTLEASITESSELVDSEYDSTQTEVNAEWESDEALDDQAYCDDMEDELVQEQDESDPDDFGTDEFDEEYMEEVDDQCVMAEQNSLAEDNFAEDADEDATEGFLMKELFDMSNDKSELNADIADDDYESYDEEECDEDRCMESLDHVEQACRELEASYKLPVSSGTATEMQDAVGSMIDPAQIQTIETAVESNAELINRVIHQLSELQQSVADLPQYMLAQRTGVDETTSDDAATAEATHELMQEIEYLRNQISSLEEENQTLSEQAANPVVQVAAPSGGPPRELTWEERKELMLRQMEDDSFDAAAFVAELDTEGTHGLDPVDYINQLNLELERRMQQVQSHEAEIKELYEQIDNQPTTESNPTTGVAMGAAAIADMVDSDELLREEREKLQEMQSEWEERFRESEIAASLERAKISRERRELALKNAELEEQLVHFRRESEQSRKAGVGNSRRWLAKLGLTDVGE